MEDEFYRIKRLPPYVIAEVNDMRAAARHAGKDIIDLTGVARVNAFGDLFLTQIDSKTVLIDFDGVLGGDTLTVQKTTIAALAANQGDFLF